MAAALWNHNNPDALGKEIRNAPDGQARHLCDNGGKTPQVVSSMSFDPRFTVKGLVHLFFANAVEILRG